MENIQFKELNSKKIINGIRSRSFGCTQQIFTEMKGGSLEVLLVNAKGIKHTNLVGKTKYYVMVQCGSQERRSKLSSGYSDEAFWNEKFVFEFSMFEWRKIEHIKFRIMDKEILTDGGFVGQSIIHIGGVIADGKERGFVELKPDQYNVVLDDDTYRGEIRIGFKFIANKELQIETEVKEPKLSTCRTIQSLWNLPLLKILLYCFRKKPKFIKKEN